MNKAACIMQSRKYLEQGTFPNEVENAVLRLSCGLYCRDLIHWTDMIEMLQVWRARYDQLKYDPMYLNLIEGALIEKYEFNGWLLLVRLLDIVQYMEIGVEPQNILDYVRAGGSL
jgi:hypothetical protein